MFRKLIEALALMSAMSRHPNLQLSTHPYLRRLAEKVIIFDGATGTWLQEHDLTEDDFGGPEFEGCNEILVDTRPELIAQMHREYLEAGADVVETNSFGSFAVPLGEYGIAERARELSRTAAEIARSVVDEISTPDHPRFVAGSMGPGTKFASLGQITYNELQTMYADQAVGLLEGGVDLFIIETQFDLLGLKAAISGCRTAMEEVGREVPIQAQVTIELTGRMLPGTEIGAALVALDAVEPDVIGINCATGPAEMSEHLRHLSAHSRVPISCLPNAGSSLGRRGQDALRPHGRGFRGAPDALRGGLRRGRGRRLLRDDTGVHPPARRGTR